MHSELRWTIRIRLPLAAMLFALVAGCQAAHVPDSVTSKFPGNEMGDQLGFWHDLAQRELTSNDDAFHGLLLYIDSTDTANGYADRVSALKHKGLLPADFNEPADLAVERGTVAYAIVKILHLRGGWVMHLFGTSPRYAVKELVNEDLFPPSSPQQTFSGSEFVGVIGKLDDYQSTASASP